ncbi:hypothetical protein C8Q77DRAFT_392816 [Trametes polyzona]|nr:hypothetical protein C8Q77DRAFT_392816 [Trametes polyzona]
MYDGQSSRHRKANTSVGSNERSSCTTVDTRRTCLRSRASTVGPFGHPKHRQVRHLQAPTKRHRAGYEERTGGQRVGVVCCAIMVWRGCAFHCFLSAPITPAASPMFLESRSYGIVFYPSLGNLAESWENETGRRSCLSPVTCRVCPQDTLPPEQAAFHDTTLTYRCPLVARSSGRDIVVPNPLVHRKCRCHGVVYSPGVGPPLGIRVVPLPDPTELIIFDCINENSPGIRCTVSGGKLFKGGMPEPYS